MAPTISLAMESIAASIFTQIREGRNATSFHGTAIQIEIYIYTTWVWLVLPMAVVFLCFVLVAVCIVMSTRSGEELWKSSALALLFFRLCGWDETDMNPQSQLELQENAKLMRGRECQKILRAWDL